MPFDKLMEPAKGLAVPFSHSSLFLIFPMRGDTVLRNTMHVFRPDLKFDVFTLRTYHCRMERLVEIRFWNCNIVLKPSRHRAPERMDDSEEGVAIHLRVRHDAQGGQIVDLLKCNRLLVHLLVDPVEVLRPAIDLPRQSVLSHGLVHELDDLLDILLSIFISFSDSHTEGFVHIRLQMLHAQIFQLILDPSNSKPVR